MAKCYYCGKKARRSCAAFIGRSICSACCREKTNTQIKCSADCPHLTTAALYREERSYRKRLQRLRLDEHLRTALPREDALDLFLALEDGIMNFHGANPSLIDRTVLEALEAAKQGYRARSSGLVLPAPAISQVAKSLGESLDKIIEKQSAGEGERRLEKDAVFEALEKLAASIKRYQSEPGGYLGFLASLR